MQLAPAASRWALLSCCLFALALLPRVARAEVAQVGDELRFRVAAPADVTALWLSSDLLGWPDRLSQRPGRASPPQPLRLVPFEHVGGGLFELRLPTPWAFEVAYKLVVDRAGGRIWTHDPSNPRRAPDGAGSYNSVVPVEYREDPLLAPVGAASAWRRVDLSLADPVVPGTGPRRVTVLSPPDAIARRKAALEPGVGSAILYFQDGSDYLDHTGVANWLARLSARPGVPLLTGVFVPPKRRMDEYMAPSRLADAYVDWLAAVVVPSVEGRLGGPFPLDRRILVGPSLGGLVTVHAGLRHPDVFRNVASQSGSLWVGQGALLPRIAAARGSGLRIYLDVGTYEPTEMAEFNRRAAQLADRAGVLARYAESPSLHDWLAWRNRLTWIAATFLDPATRARRR